MPTLETHNGYPLWNYIPSRPASAIFIVLFALATAYHTFLLFKNRHWFCLPFVIGGFFETIGYVGRFLAYDKTGELIPYMLQSIFLLLAPILFAASLYMTLGRVIRAVDGEEYSIVRSKWITAIFVTGDVVSFMIQGGGAGMLVKADSASSHDLGQNIIIGGLIFQILIFGIFCVVSLSFHLRFARNGLVNCYLDVPWAAILKMLYATSGLVMVRNVFRVVEYATGQDGYLLTNEWCVYVFDGLLMFLAMIFFALRYPSHLYSKYRPGTGLELLNRGDSAKSQDRKSGLAYQCDEAKPQCGNCTAVERSCEYAAIRRRKLSQAQLRREAARQSDALQLRSSNRLQTIPETSFPPIDEVATTASTPARVTSTTASPGHAHAANGADPDAAVNIHHMRLIVHFSLSTAVPEIPDHLAKGGTELVLRIALETPYLLHQVLALSSRYLAHLHPDQFEFYYGQAIKFQTNAIEGFSAAQPLSSDACMPAVLFSSLLSRHSLVDTLNTRGGDFEAFLDSFVQCAQLQRGIRAVVTGVSWSSLLKSDLAPFLRWGTSGLHATTRGHECDQLLRLIAITPGLDAVARESCRTAVHHLQVGLDDLANPVPDKNSYQMIFSWSIYLPEEFIELLSQHRPEAAAIMGWYAVLLHYGRNMWQIGDAGEFFLSSLVDFLGLQWSHWLEWPRSVVDA
ncbi:hypothetical protein NLG97_g1497 [Lecanicillium saksenae]|uniref:Uncharacterized protein n=1 Tax=Lecanicillium saksenae TaxID=468837 RepID=A0ACC1R687_9HYPO|nr:hypothetical protein NLG97_g1497 [Lecanicillium saksenae]